jgi:hypothetical protein
MNNKERKHIESVKNLPCGVCGAYPPSDAHHILENSRRISHYMVIALCKSCHQDLHNGIHGNKAMWNVMRKTELSVLSDTIERLI